MPETKNRLSAAAQDKSTTSLRALVFTNIDLAMQFRQAHWNVRRAENFGDLHSLFGEGYELLAEQQDTMAERIAQFGKFVSGDIRDASRESWISTPANSKRSDGAYLCDDLAGKAASYSKALVVAFEAATESRDHGTADMLIGMAQDVDKLVWKLEAHLE